MCPSVDVSTSTPGSMMNPYASLTVLPTGTTSNLSSIPPGPILSTPSSIPMDLDRSVPSSEDMNEEAEVEVGVEVHGLGRLSSEAILIPLDRATLEGCVIVSLLALLA
jgi:hypothetical protein